MLSVQPVEVPAFGNFDRPALRRAESFFEGLETFFSKKVSRFFGDKGASFLWGSQPDKGRGAHVVP